jgi:alpha-beta hydrolase superfamily lysophospholipase
MKLSRKWKISGAILAVVVIVVVIFLWIIGSILVAPSNHPIGDPPSDLAIKNVEFPSASGATIHGWFIAGEPGKGAIILMHGVHADRRAMISRAEFLSRAGYAILLFDFQAHGESIGKQITFGYLESRDATAAVDFIRKKLPGEKIGVIGVSMGAAAALLAEPPLPVNALVLESCYPTIYHATEDRMIDRFGFFGRLLTPLLTCQLKPRLGIGLDDLKPVDHAGKISVPKIFIAGTQDKLTTIQEAQALYEAAAEPKQFWPVAGAGHVNMDRFDATEYQPRILKFFSDHLR